MKMDLVVCEAPLDNSFQKGRRELVSKGSLGRRRKPSRTNLRLILSPGDDRQDIGAFHQNHHRPHSDVNFSRANSPSPNRLEESASDAKRGSLTNGHHVDSSAKFQISNYSNHRRYNRFENSPSLAVASDNYREVVASINQIYSLRSADINGNSDDCQSVVLRSDNRRVAGQSAEDYSPLVATHEARQKVGNGNVKSDRRSVAKNQKNNANTKSEHLGGKVCNGDYDVAQNGYHEIGRLNANEFRNGIHTLKITNQQDKVAAKNQLNFFTSSNHRQITTSTPVENKKPASSYGRYSEVTALQRGSPKLHKESSLPRTSREPSLVDEAQQFSIEAKLRRKKSEANTRSDILIQTWERRTQAELWRRDSKGVPKSRFCGATMPDSYICAKYKGSLQNGRSLRELVLNVRDVVSPDKTMLYRVPGQRHRRFHEEPLSNGGRVAVNGNSSAQEPEWISLSKKLCAKFVEGHIEPPYSPDSYSYEEPEGVKPETPSSHQPKTPSGATTQQSKVDVSKRKKVPPTLSEESTPDGEPPWIHLSRKLCNKFIEEHIEYPPVSNGHLAPVAPELVEPNGDVRIVERVGRPKRRGSKQKKKKDSEPEWVSLSKKLRAKFIESHLDDPDTIALDNQLNASDPEETGSETLSDVSQDLSVSKENGRPLEPVECRNFTVRTQVPDKEENIQELEDKLAPGNSVIFPDKECCWEYQEMEFDQESNSGNFHEPEVPGEPLQEARIHRGTLPEDDLPHCAELATFVNHDNSQFVQNAECFNNDVKFLPLGENAATLSSDSQEPSKLITVQFIAHSRNDSHNKRESKDYVPYFSKSSLTGSHSNLATWEEACYVENTDELPTYESANSNKRVLSKSLDNLCDSLEPNFIIPKNDFEYDEGRNSLRTTWNAACEDRKLSFSGDSNLIRECDKFSDKTKEDVKKPVHGDSGDASIENDKEILLSSNAEHSRNIRNNSESTSQIESSSDDEVFECDPASDKLSSKLSEASYGKISSRKSPAVENETQKGQAEYKRVKHSGSNTANCKNAKCNGMIPNSIYNGFSSESSSCSNQSTNIVQNGAPKEPVKLGMSKWITVSKSEQNLNKPENTKLKSTLQKESKTSEKSSVIESGMNGKERKDIDDRKMNGKQRKVSNENGKTAEHKNTTKKSVSPKNSRPKYANYQAECQETYGNSNKVNGFTKEFDFKNKCKSLCDISYNNHSFQNENGFNHHESVTDLSSPRQVARHPEIEFQHFESDSEIPLCAKLVSRHEKKTLSKNNARASSSPRREDSPSYSETSHVYEDMFKETPSGPSDSETSSWVMRNNTYYVSDNRSCSMNDLDFSDSGSVSVKCDYASSSQNSTLQSRRSSLASSSFYVNLRDYDSHMLEPSLRAGRKASGKSAVSSSFSRSNPPTPESLRHLFTSPLSSIHSPPNRAARLLNRMPSDPQSHYYSTAAATSSAFKHGFAASPPKPKKAERSSSLKIKDIAHGIMLTFRKFQNHGKSPGVSSTQQVDVSHLAEMNGGSESSGKAKKGHKSAKPPSGPETGCPSGYWTVNGTADTDSGFLSDAQRAKARRSSSDLTDMRSNSELFRVEKKKGKGGKKNTNRDKEKKSRSKSSDSRTVPTVSRKVQQMADGTLYLVTTVSGDTSMPGVYSDSPDTSSELSVHKSVKASGESNC